MTTRRRHQHPPIINAVINSSLMNNHQLELAEELEKRSHIRVSLASEWTTDEEAKQFWIKLGQFQPVLFAGMERGPNYVSSFQRIVDEVMSVPDCDHNSHKPDSDLTSFKKDS